MMFDFSQMPFFDNHTHLLNVTNREINLKEYMSPLNHGYVDTIAEHSFFAPGANAGNNTPQWISDDMFRNVTCNMAIAKTWVHYLSQYFGCEETPEAVLAERNRRSMQDMKAYTRGLYEDQHIIAEVVDDPQLPIVANLNIGHATPRCILPFGVQATVDAAAQRITFDCDCHPAG